MKNALKKKVFFFVKATNVVNATNRHWLLLQTDLSPLTHLPFLWSPYMVEFTTTGEFTRLFKPNAPLFVCGDGRKTARASYCQLCLKKGKKCFNWSADAARKHKITYH